MNEAEHTIKQLREGDELTISSVYKSNREKFISYARRFDINREDIIDIYQDAIIALTENAKKGLLDGLKSEISTYLFSIGKYMIYNHLKKNKNLPLFEKNIP
ncbi:MAG TPA: sigma factor, partial [Chitinophagales bacterium]|nr:sigma factor [Chitinophagales bacterium]